MYVTGQGHTHWGPGTSMVQFTRPATGMGHCCSSCAHGGKCSGLGLFDSGFDLSGWGWQEWTIAGLGAYMLFSTVFTTGRAARAVGRLPGERRKRKAASLRKRASELSRA